MGIFRRRPGLEIITDRCWNDPDLDALVDRLEAPGRPEEKVYAALTAMASAKGHPTRSVLVADACAERLVDSLPALVARASARGHDPEADADACALAAKTLIEYAWSVRGGGRATSVREDAWPVFFGSLEEADQFGAQAMELRPGHPAAGVARITCARGLQLPPEESWRRFQEVTEADRTLYPAHTQLLQNICEKWSGSHAEMLDFARTVTICSPAGDPIGAMLALAWCELDLENEDGSNVGATRTDDQALVADAADRWLAGGEAALAHPYATAAHQLFGWFLADLPGQARLHLSRTGGRMAFYPWAYSAFGSRAYRKALKAAGVTC